MMTPADERIMKKENHGMYLLFLRLILYGMIGMLFFVVTSLTVLSFDLNSNVINKNVSGSSTVITWTITNPNFVVSDYVSYYRFENNSIDTTGYNNGTVDGATYIAGHTGTGILFDGINDQVTTTVDMNLDSNTILFWFKPKESQTQSPIGFNLFRPFYAESRNNGMKCAYRTDSETGYIVPTVPTLNTWNFGVCRYNGTHICGSVNGNLLSCTPKTGNIDNSQSNVLVIGDAMITAGQPFNGSVDSVRIYTRALTQAEITQVYQSEYSQVHTCSVYASNTLLSSGLTGNSYTWDISGIFNDYRTVNITCTDSQTSESNTGNYGINLYNAVRLQYLQLQEQIKINEAMELIPFVLLWLGLWVLGFYAIQNYNNFLGITLILLTIPINIYFSYKFQETVMLGTGYMGVAFGLMSALTIVMLFFLRSRNRHVV